MLNEIYHRNEVKAAKLAQEEHSCRKTSGS
jgi:hypothetical protein